MNTNANQNQAQKRQGYTVQKRRVYTAVLLFAEVFT